MISLSVPSEKLLPAVSKIDGVVYQAESDGFVMAYTGVNSTAITLVADDVGLSVNLTVLGTYSYTGGGSASAIQPVAKGQYYKTTGGTLGAWFRPKE